MSSASPLPRPCLDCGEPSTATRCEPCRREHERERSAHADAARPTTAGRGYGSAWARLSKKARALQPFCTDCGSPDDLTADHTPEAWERVDAGLPLRLRDIVVLCRSCNSSAGAARGPSARRDATETWREN